MSVSIQVFDLQRFSDDRQVSGTLMKPQAAGSTINLSLRPRVLALSLAGAATLLFLLGLIEQYVTAHSTNNAIHSVAYRFRLDAEATIPMWFSSMLMLVCSLLAAVAALVHRHQRRADVWRWGMISVILLGMSMDEAVVLHEMAIRVIRGFMPTSGLFFYAWVVVAIPAVVVVASLGAPMLRRLPRRTAVGLPLSATIFCVGAIGMEMVGGKVFEAAGETATLIYVVVTSLEEGLEMAGLVVCFYVLLDYLAVLEHEIATRPAR